MHTNRRQHRHIDNGMSGLCKALLGTIWIVWIPWNPTPFKHPHSYLDISNPRILRGASTLPCFTKSNCCLMSHPFSSEKVWQFLLLYFGGPAGHACRGACLDDAEGPDTGIHQQAVAGGYNHRSLSPSSRPTCGRLCEHRFLLHPWRMLFSLLWIKSSAHPTQTDSPGHHNLRPAAAPISSKA